MGLGPRKDDAAPGAEGGGVSSQAQADALLAAWQACAGLPPAERMAAAERLCKVSGATS